MTLTSRPAYTIAAYSSDLWEHVCPIIRIIEPMAQAGMKVTQGNEWDYGPVEVRTNIIDEADFVVIQRDFPKYVEPYENIIAYSRRLGKPIVYELDDNLVELGLTHPDVDHYLEIRPSILRAVLEADAVTTSTTHLADYLRVFNPNVYVLPNFLVDKFWTGGNPEPRAVVDSTPITIGYMGGHSHAPDIEMIAPVLERLLDRYGDRITLQFWGVKPSDNLANRPYVNWTFPYLAKYVDFARYFRKQSCDIFIAPLQNNLFNQCKSGLKYLEYSNLGVPGVYSNLSPYSDLVKNGEDGFLANGLDEWEVYLSRLIENADLRNSMGNAARSGVEKRWLLSRNAKYWEDIYTQILKGYSKGWEGLSEPAFQLVRRSQHWYIDLAQRAKFQQNQINEFLELEKRLKRKLEDQQQLINQLENTSANLRFQIADRENSLAWKLTLKLMSLRVILAPNGSFRERIFRHAISAVHIWRRQGLWAMMAQVMSRLSRRPVPQGSIPAFALSDPRIKCVPTNGVRVKSPTFSVIQILSEDETLIQVDQILDWLNRQTLPDWEYVIWDQKIGKAWQQGEPDQVWTATNLQSLTTGLSGKYACVVSSDLLQQNETYLEINLVALESEKLVFSVNIIGNADWTKYYFENGLFPGSKHEPLLRTCVSVNFLRENFTIDIADLFRSLNSMALVVGKIIVHTNPEADIEGSLKFDQRLEHAVVTLMGQSIVVRPGQAEIVANLTHTIHPVDQVIPIPDSDIDRPTVLLFMPFLAVGGAERVALDMITYLKDDIRFVVLTLDIHDPAIGTTVNAFRKLTPFVYTARDFLNNNLNFSFVSYLIRKFKPCTFYIANGSPWIFDAILMIKQIFPELRFACQVYDHREGWINRYDRMVAQIMDANIGVNEKICQAFIEKGVRQGTEFKIENGVNTEEFDPCLYNEVRIISLKQKLNIDPEKKIVVFMARLHPQKRPMDFVEVARRCKEDPNLHFLLIGDGSLAKVIDDEIAKIGLKNITRLSFYRPSSDIFAICDVYVLPSEYEGMPMVVLEAQSMGKPVVITDVGNNREVLNITHGGVCVKKIGSINDLRQGIYSMLNTPPNSNAIRQAIIDHFSIKVMGENYRKALLGN
jgi:glycosyltransferase involved in cell wall biosynthesis